MILVDTSVWIRHFRVADIQLVRFLREQRAYTCDVVAGELLLGAGLPGGVDRQLALIPSVPVPTSKEALAFIDRHQRSFRAAGVGWADVQIIVSAAKAGALLLTRDRPQRNVWRKLGYRFA